MDLAKIKKTLNAHRAELASEYGVASIGVFGSYARNEQRKGSDVDILIEFSRPVGFVAFMRLEAHLQKLLGVKVDLVTKNALKPFIGRHILREVVLV